VNSDYLSVLNKRLLSENEQLKKIKVQSCDIIKTLNENLVDCEKRIKEQQEHLQIANNNLPKGDVELRLRRSKERDTSVNKKLKFDVNQKDEAIKFKDKSLKIANQEIKELRKSIIQLKDSINLYEDKNISLQSQIKAK